MTMLTIRRRATVNAAATIPPWPELQRLDATAVQGLCRAHGIEYVTRSKALSALNRAR